MIWINQGETKRLYFTLYETSELPNPYYLFEFTSNDTGNKTYATNDDNSIWTPRYNSFTFSVSSGSPTAGYIDLKSGTYDYRVYETEYQYNLNPGSASKVVEIGLMVVNSTQSFYNPTYNNNDTDEEYVYE